MLTILAALALATQQPEQDQACARFGDMAEAIMRNRQAEVPMSKTLEGLPKNPEWLYLILRDVVREAYGKQALYGPEAQAREVARFRNIWEQACFANMSDKPD
jgi:hypothetical protein